MKINKSLSVGIGLLAISVGSLIGIGVNSQKASFVSAAYEVIDTIDFTKKSSSNTGYTDPWDYGTNATVKGGANNNGGWTYIKLGAKSANLANPNYVNYKGAIADSVSKITVALPAGSLAKSGMSVTSWGVEVYSDSAFSTSVDTVAGGTITSSVGSFDFVPSDAYGSTSWAANLYYRVSWTLANTSTSNGIVCCESVKFYKTTTSSNPAIASDKETLAINKSGSGTFTLSAINCTPDHYGVVSDATAVATASISNNVATINGVASGSAIITATAYDSLNAALATTTVSVTVNAQALKASPATTTMNTGTAKDITLTPSYFNGAITYFASSSDETVATVNIADPSIGAAVINSLSKAGTATITYTATDGTDSATATTAVTVEAASLALSQSSLTMSLALGAKDITVTPSRFNGDATYSTSFSTAGIASASVSGTTVSITPIAIGNTTLTVTGTYGTQTATASCAINVANLITGNKRLTISNTSGNHTDGDIVAEVTTAGSLLTWNSDYFTMTQAKSTSTNDIVTSYDEIRAYGSHLLTWTPTTGVSITSIVANCDTTGYASALKSSTYANATASVSDKVVTITPTAQTTAVSVTLSAQSRIDSFVVNYSFTLTPEFWAIDFLNNTGTPCSSGENNATPSSDLLAAWGTANAEFGILTSAQKATIHDAAVDTSNMGKAVQRYDYILAKYGVSAFSTKGGNFIDRTVGGSSSISFGENDSNNNETVIIVSSLFLILGAVMAAYVFKKKRA